MRLPRGWMLLAGLVVVACGTVSPSESESPTTAVSGATETVAPTSVTTAASAPETTTPPMATTIEPGAGPDDSHTWSRVPHNDRVFGGEGPQEMWGVTAGVSGFAAVGVDGPIGDSDAAVWTSPDGIVWTRVPDEGSVLGMGDWPLMRGVAGGASGFVAAGSDETHAAVWTSQDGTAWIRVPHDESVFGAEGPYEMSSVTGLGTDWVAVGIDWSSTLPDAAAWTSRDGLTWSRVPNNEGVFGDGRSWLQMDHVAPGGPGLVAVGFEAFIADSDAAVWTSPDGITWSRVPHNEEVFGGNGWQWTFGVTAGGPGLVAVGAEGAVDSGGAVDSDAAVWTSPDGITWSRVPHDEEVLGGDGDQNMRSVAAGGPGLVAVGFDGPIADPDAAVWTSPDGLTWSRVLHDEAVFGGGGIQRLNDVSAGGPGIVAVGFDNGDAAVWVATTED